MACLKLRNRHPKIKKKKKILIKTECLTDKQMRKFKMKKQKKKMKKILTASRALIIILLQIIIVLLLFYVLNI